MNRAYLCGAIEGLVSQCGYEFHLDYESHYPTTVCRYPAAFMSQPQFESIEGRKHGRIAYKVKLRLAQNGAKLSPTERNQRLNEMESELIEIFTQLSKDRVVAVVKELTISPVAEAVDNHGAVATIAEAVVETIF